MNLRKSLWDKCLLLGMLAIFQPLQAQSPDLVCTEAARTLVEGSRSTLDNTSTTRSTAQNEIRWSTNEGHKGVCRVDADGRVYEIAVTQFPPKASSEYSLNCTSDRYRRKECPLKEPGKVRLDRQLSSSQCTQNRTWGQDNLILWVDQGCSGRFIVTTQPKWEPYTLTCESFRNSRTECKLKGEAEVSINRQLSSTYCRLNTNWGVNKDLLWVDKGCRAVFQASPLSTGGSAVNVRTAALRACEGLTRSKGYEVLSARVIESESNHVDVELLGERKPIQLNLFCRYDTTSKKATLYGF